MFACAVVLIIQGKELDVNRAMEAVVITVRRWAKEASSATVQTDSAYRPLNGKVVKVRPKRLQF